MPFFCHYYMTTHSGTSAKIKFFYEVLYREGRILKNNDCLNSIKSTLILDEMETMIYI